MNQYVITYPSCNGLELTKPDCQRPLISTVVDEMVEHAKTEILSQKLPIFGTIDVAIYKNQFGMIFYLVDGQHRYEALKKLYSIGYTQIPVHTMNYICNDYDDVRKIFRIRNLNVVVPEYIMTSSSRTSLLNNISMFLRTFSSIFCEKKNRPYIYLPDFMNKLSDSRWIRSIHDIEDFKKKIASVNINLRTRLDNIDFKRSQTISPQMELHWNSNQIYLGVDKYYSWMGDE